jgi:hypothetical protein
MTQIGMSDQSDERRLQFEAEALRIVDAAREKGLVLRLLGSLAFRLHCPEYGYLQKQLGRAYTDIDYAGYGGQASQMAPLLTALGYHEDAEINLLYAGQRMIFNHNGLGIHTDIFFDKLSFCHEIAWKNRLDDDFPTIPLAEMLLEKMQIVKINEKDIIDTIMLLLEHPLGDHDRETINIARVSGLCAQDWGLWRTLTMNLRKVGQLAQGYTELGDTEKAKLASQVETALERIDREPKTVSWKLRSKIGDRVKWYQEVDDVT